MARQTAILLKILVIAVVLFYLPCLAMTKTNQKSNIKENSVVEKSLKYYVLHIPKGYKEIVETKMSPDKAAAHGNDDDFYLDEGRCIAAYPNFTEGNGGRWIRVYYPHVNDEKWLPQQLLVPSNMCEEAYELAKDFFFFAVNNRKSTKNKINMRTNDEEQFRAIVPWIKTHTGQSIRYETNYMPESDELCDTFCSSEYVKKKTFLDKSFVWSFWPESFYITDQELAEKIGQEAIEQKWKFISKMNLAVIKNRIVFFYTPNGAHRAEWHFNRINGKWQITILKIQGD